MSTAYLWLKAVHVLAVTIWLGGAVTLLAITSLLSPDLDQKKLAAIAEVCDFVGARVVGPAASITILAGLLTVWIGHVKFALWVWGGLGSGILVLVIGLTALRLGFRRLAGLLNEPQIQTAAVADQARRIRMFGALAVTLLVVTVALMVLKPTL